MRLLVWSRFSAGPIKGLIVRACERKCGKRVFLSAVKGIGIGERGGRKEKRGGEGEEGRRRREKRGGEGGEGKEREEGRGR